MRKLIISILSMALFGATAFGQKGKEPADGSFLERLQERDSVLIGDQLRYGFHLRNVPEGVALMLPDFSKGFMPGDSVEIVRSWEADTLKTYGPKKSPKSRDIDFSVVITSFEEGKYLLPPLSVIKEATPGAFDTLFFKPQELEVFTIPIDTATFKIHDIKGQIKYPVTFAEVLPYLASALLIALLALLVRYLVITKRKKNSLGTDPDEPAYLVALRKLEKFRGDKYWAKEKQKAFYSGITDALREYMDARFGIDAPEMTTSEIFGSLSHSDVPTDLFVETRRLFETADMVKFAKAYATDEENAAAVPLAVRFVTSTYQTDSAPAGYSQETQDGQPNPSMTENQGGAE